MVRTTRRRAAVPRDEAQADDEDDAPLAAPPAKPTTTRSSRGRVSSATAAASEVRLETTPRNKFRADGANFAGAPTLCICARGRNLETACRGAAPPDKRLKARAGPRNRLFTFPEPAKISRPALPSRLSTRSNRNLTRPPNPIPVGGRRPTPRVQEAAALVREQGRRRRRRIQSPRAGRGGQGP